MRYAKLSCTEFYPRYLQQCAQLTYSLIGLLAMARSWNWLFIFFRELNMVLGAHVVLCITEPDVLKKMFYSQNGENRPSPGFFECIENFSFLSVWPIRKVYITVIPVCLNKFHIWENFGFWDMAQNALRQSDCRIFESIARLANWLCLTKKLMK